MKKLVGRPQGKTNSIRASQYVSHLGDSKTFTSKMEAVLDEYGALHERLIFITDGATWIKNWIADAYPKAMSVLDFYHAKEYLCAFARDYFSNGTQRHSWVRKKEGLLLDSQAQQVIDEIYALNKTQQLMSGIKVIEYYSSNIGRMKYACYKTIGKGLIGSGAIESAHKTVIQCRMKLSGQR